MEAAAAGSLGSPTGWNSAWRRKTISFAAMPTLLTIYFIGAGVAFLICTRTFASFSPDSQVPVELFRGLNSSGYEKPAGLMEQQAVLEELKVPPHALADRVVVEAMITNATTLQADDDGEPEFMQNPVIRREKLAQAAELGRRLKLMSRAERRRWVQENWSSFKILKEDNVSEQFGDRMREFLCNSNSTAHLAAFGNSSSANPTSSLRHKIDEAHLCAPNPSSFCTERFFLTWISPVASFSPRERLGLESIFKHHPSACVVILSRAMDSEAGRAILASFVARGYRVTAVTPDVNSLFSGTPAAKWLSGLRDGTGDPGCINLMQNLSNLMRLAAIYKYGGVYLDTDVIVVKSFSPLRNVVGAQSQDPEGQWTRLNNAVLVFDREHPFVFELLQEFQATFDGSRWGWNGPYLVSRVATKVLQVQKWRNCSDVAVLPTRAFYPVNWIDIVKFFHKPTEDHENKTLQMKEASRITNLTYSIHLWNKMSSHLRVQPGSIMESLFKRSCLFC